MSHDHHHDHSPSSLTALKIAFVINALFMLVEFIGGLISNSLALLADAGHMLADVAALAMALAAAKIAARPASIRRTYGYGRAKVLSALINGLSLWLIVGIILWEAVHRFLHPPQVQASSMLVIAVLGLATNFSSAAVLWKFRTQDVNIKGAFLHLLGDSLGSVGVILAGLCMLFFGWFWVDPLASIVISVIILWSSWGIIKESVYILLESSPPGVNASEVKSLLESLPGVKKCHDLHIWSIGSDEPVLTAHLIISAQCDRESLLNQAVCLARDKFGVSHSTIQLEFDENHHDLGCGQAHNH